MLSLPGAVTVGFEEPAAPDGSGTPSAPGTTNPPEAAEDPPQSVTQTPDAAKAGTGAGLATDALVCATPGCGRPATAGQRFCGRCLRDPAARARTWERTFRILTPWSDVIEIPDGTSLAIGRDPGFCSFAARMADSLYVSRRHLFLRVAASRIFVRDLGSHNGTARNGDRLTPDNEVELVTNDAITLGGQETFFVVV